MPVSSSSDDKARADGVTLQAARAPYSRFTGFRVLLYKELLRFWKVSFQTVAAPVITALLYLAIFGHALQHRVDVYAGIDYVSFLVPGLVMMSVLQNAFANSSSSLIQSKITGNLIFMLLPPLSHWDMFAAYTLASIVRGLVVGLGVFIVTVWFVPLHCASLFYIIGFGLLGAGILAVLGLIAGIVASKFDQLAAFQNFLIMPLTFLSGVFYSTHSLPPFWRQASHFNPFFYMIDGFRYGFFGQSDCSPLLSLSIVGFFFLLLSGLAVRMLATGFKLRH
ncbi:ABC transporter permease [Robbsia sp. KACC 23696]|uniref:ABC transporter permease n=1 Tax=Robbsia sp. KACC 23696 TaxID=3149231 RepID=UPI00325AC094